MGIIGEVHSIVVLVVYSIVVLVAYSIVILVVYSIVISVCVELQEKAVWDEQVYRNF